MTLAALAVAAVLAPAAPHPPAPAPPAPIAYGTIAVCSVAGSRPVAGTLTYTLAAPASAGGTQTTTVAVGACSTPAFYPTGTALSIVEIHNCKWRASRLVSGGRLFLSRHIIER